MTTGFRRESAFVEREDERLMRIALAAADTASASGELPVGAAVVCGENVVVCAANSTERDGCAASHAELNAISEACAVLGRKTLEGCTLYVTLEPCPMCAGAIFLARLDRVVFGASDPAYGAFGGMFDLFELAGLSSFRPAVTGGVLAEECAKRVTVFFRKKRESLPADAVRDIG